MSAEQSSPEAVLAYWIDELGEKGWYAGGAALDDEIRARFAPTWEAAMAGRLQGWLAHARDALAYMIVTDQFPRNMFRGTARAYASDRLARAGAELAIDRGYDLKIDRPQRQFFYMPFEHSESLTDQDRAVRLIAMRLESPEHLLHARAHREVIRRYGRFPFRNAHLGRKNTDAEAAFMAAGAYPHMVELMRAA